MISLLIIMNTLVVFLFTYWFTNDKFTKIEQILLSLTNSVIGILYVSIIFFYTYMSDKLDDYIIILVVLVVITITLFVKAVILSERYLLEVNITIYNTIVLSTGLIISFIYVVNFHNFIHYIYQVVIYVFIMTILVIIRKILSNLIRYEADSKIFIRLIVVSGISLFLLNSVVYIDNIEQYTDRYEYDLMKNEILTETIYFEEISPAIMDYNSIFNSYEDEFVVRDNFVYFIFYGWYIYDTKIIVVDLDTGAHNIIYTLEKTDIILDDYIELVEYNDELFLVSAEGLYKVEGINLIPVFEKSSITGVQHEDFYGALYTVDGNLIYENEDNIFIYFNNSKFIVAHDYSKQKQVGYSLFSYGLNYYSILIEDQKVTEMYGKDGLIDMNYEHDFYEFQVYSITKRSSISNELVYYDDKLDEIVVINIDDVTKYEFNFSNDVVTIIEDGVVTHFTASDDRFIDIYKSGDDLYLISYNDDWDRVISLLEIQNKTFNPTYFYIYTNKILVFFLIAVFPLVKKTDNY